MVTDILDGPTNCKSIFRFSARQYPERKMTWAVCDQQLELQPWYSEHHTVSFKKHDHMFAK